MTYFDGGAVCEGVTLPVLFGPGHSANPCREQPICVQFKGNLKSVTNEKIRNILLAPYQLTGYIRASNGGSDWDGRGEHGTKNVGLLIGCDPHKRFQGAT